MDRAHRADRSLATPVLDRRDSGRVLPAPSDVVLAGWRLLRTGELPRNIWVSFWRAIVGLAIGGGIGFALGLANGLSRRSERATDTTLQMIRNIPHLAVIPLVILWFGIDESAKIFLVAVGVFFPIYVNTQHGIRTVDPQLVEMARTYGMSPVSLFRRVYLPGALPSIFVGLRYALGIMWLTLIVAETIAASAGIGYMAMQARVGLEDRRDDWPSVLSGGQKQRVALARALVSRPRVLAFDEPLGALDALTRISMQKLLEQVWLDQPFTAILVTHDVAEAVTLADRVLVIEGGAIAIDVAVDLPRPRAHGSAELAQLAGRILGHLLGSSRAGDDA
jgi:ABC-type nitrate/sulfonate/bicarbonate transport system permease component